MNTQELIKLSELLQWGVAVPYHRVNVEDAEKLAEILDRWGFYLVVSNGEVFALPENLH